MLASALKYCIKPSTLFNVNLLQIRNQSNLSKLRKTTGYPLTSCRKALESCNNDVDSAAKWLEEQAQKEGWSKAEKLKDRSTSQGLLGFLKAERSAAIVELNCETDFVARSEKFQSVLQTLTESVLTNLKTDKNKETLFRNDLLSIVSVNGRTIGDELALGIGNLGENMSLRRAVLFNTKDDEHMAWYAHGADSTEKALCKFGKYVALVSLKMNSQPDGHAAFDVGRQIAQHIVGMKPTSIGDAPTTPLPTQEAGEELKFDDNETRLLHQEFLMQPGLRVYDFLQKNNAVIVDFVRVQCAETIENEPK